MNLLKNSTKINYLAAYIFIVTSGFFITKLPLSPIYFTMLLSAYLLGLRFLSKNTIHISWMMLIPVVYVIYVLISQVILSGDLHTVINVLMSLVYFILSLMLIYCLSKGQLIHISIRMIQLSLPLLIFEAYYRLANPIYILDNGFDYRTEEDQFFYPFKLNSIMYQDSNFVGIFILSLFFFACYLTNKFKKKLGVEKLLLVSLLLLTISRAAIISFIIFLCINYIWSKKSVFLKITFLIVSIIISAAGLIKISTDESFQTKFQLLNLFLDFFKESNIATLLFGVGFGNTKYLFGMGAHNFIITHVVESGLIGFSILLSLWLSIIIKSKKKSLIIMLPFLLVGMSLAGHAIPYLYAIFAIIITLERNPNDTVQQAR